MLENATGFQSAIRVILADSSNFLNKSDSTVLSSCPAEPHQKGFSDGVVDNYRRTRSPSCSACLVTKGIPGDVFVVVPLVFLEVLFSVLVSGCCLFVEVAAAEIVTGWDSGPCKSAADFSEGAPEEFCVFSLGLVGQEK